MVTGLSKAWIGINNTPTELNMGTGRKEVVLYDHTVAANINLTAGNKNDCYYQNITFPDYTGAAGDEHYDYIYCEYTFIGDAHGIPSGNGYAPEANSDISYRSTTGTRSFNLHRTTCPDIGGTTFYFNRLSGRTISIARRYGVYGDNTFESGSYTGNFHIYLERYLITLSLYYNYTTNTTILNNQNIQHRLRIVGVI